MSRKEFKKMKNRKIINGINPRASSGLVTTASYGELTQKTTCPPRGFKKIAIIGYGRFGQLLEKMLSPYGEVYITSRRVNVKINNRIQFSDLKNMDLVIPAVPISKFEEVVKSINPYLKQGSLVMDVCSVKVEPCRWLKKHIDKNIEILGSHPMFGPDSIKGGYENLQIVLCPIRISAKKLQLVKSIFRDLELKIISATPKEHDRQSAKSLALVHFVGRGLDSAKIKKQNISSLGFERLLTVNETVCNDTWQLFIDMTNYNPYAQVVRDKFIKSLISLNKKIIKEKK